MAGYIIDLAIVAALVIGITAINGVIGDIIGRKLFGGKNKNVFTDQTKKTQVGWKSVGGTK